MIQPRPSYFFPLTTSHSFSSLLHSSPSFSIIFSLCHRRVTHEHAYTLHTHTRWRTDADTSPQMGESREGWFLRMQVFHVLQALLEASSPKSVSDFPIYVLVSHLSICGFCESYFVLEKSSHEYELSVVPHQKLFWPCLWWMFGFSPVSYQKKIKHHIMFYKQRDGPCVGHHSQNAVPRTQSACTVYGRLNEWLCTPADCSHWNIHNNMSALHHPTVASLRSLIQPYSGSSYMKIILHQCKPTNLLFWM